MPERPRSGYFDSWRRRLAAVAINKAQELWLVIFMICIIIIIIVIGGLYPQELGVIALFVAIIDWPPALECLLSTS